MSTTRPSSDAHREADLRKRITYVELKNFRAFRQAKCRLGPITLLLGLNNAGKSSLLSSVRLLSQTLQNPDWDIPLAVGEFGTYKDLVHGNDNQRTLGLALGFTHRNVESSFAVNFRYRSQRRQIILQDFGIFDEEARPLLQTKYSKDLERQVVKKLEGFRGEALKQLTKPVGTYHYFPRLSPIKFELDRLSREDTSLVSTTRGLSHVDQLIRRATTLLQSVQYLGPFREPPSRIYSFSGERPSGLNPVGGGTAEILVGDFFRRGTRKQELTNLARTWLGKAGMAKDLVVRNIGDRHFEIRIQHPDSNEVENIVDVGFGVSQILPVVVGGYHLSPGSVFLIEQPELHLHPRAQVALGDFFCDLYARNVQCIVETHSAHLISRLQKHVAEGRIPAGDVAVNYIAAGTAAKRIREIPLNDEGVFTEPWPDAFLSESFAEAEEFSRAARHDAVPVG